MPVAVVTDSTHYLPRELVERLLGGACAEIGNAAGEILEAGQQAALEPRQTGGVVRRTNRRKIPFAEGVKHAGKATAWVFRLAALSPRVKRVYFYQWAPAPDPKASWDSALIDRKGRPRPALAILQTWLLRHAPASSS